MLLGAGLHKAGHTVLLVGRPANIDAINRDGLTIITGAEEEVLYPPATADYREIKSQANDIILLCVKAHQTVQAVKEMKEVFPAVTPVISIQNGVHNEKIIEKGFKTVISSVVIIFGMNLAPGIVDSGNWRHPYGYLELGEYNSKVTDSPLVKKLCDILNASEFVAIPNRDIRKAQWGKLLLNLGNAVHAITDVRISTEFFKLILDEAEAVLIAADIDYESRDALLKRFTRLTGKPFRFTLSGEKPYLGSSWQSLKLKKGHVEVDHFNGEICNLAKKIHIQVPLNQLLLETCNEMANSQTLPGKYSETQLLNFIKKRI